MNKRNYYVYMMASINRIIYVGVTNDLIKRVLQHKGGYYDGFTKKYKISKLVYYENFDTAKNASDREKEIKKWRREKKVKLLEDLNPEWKDLFEEIVLFSKIGSRKK